MTFAAEMDLPTQYQPPAYIADFRRGYPNLILQNYSLEQCETVQRVLVTSFAQPKPVRLDGFDRHGCDY